ATARADTQSPLWHPEPAERSCAAGEATPMAFSYRLFDTKDGIKTDITIESMLSETPFFERASRARFIY
ncbi:hypothetical protein, partial [Collinsella aerofaciens]|uniref:hypothetical protein n=1 Tax=Collinsella aerofaciens TaxID=74426 RepID=UPI001C02B659